VLHLLSLRWWQCSNGRPFSCCFRFIVSEHETLSSFPIYTWYQHSEFCLLDVLVGWRLFSSSVMLMKQMVLGMEYWWTNCWSVVTNFWFVVCSLVSLAMYSRFIFLRFSWGQGLIYLVVLHYAISN
jgi:hypothetical protein